MSAKIPAASRGEHVNRLGSLCTGYGGLDLAAEHVLGPLTHTWHAEIDPHASQVLAHHWPGVPNLGDLTTVDWTRVEPVDVLTAGYPCQPLSLAGRRAGMTDERWIWDDILAAVRVLRPQLVLLENVPGHLSLGFGRVLGDLASAGFDAEWGCVRASDVGAPHRRERVFIAAWPAADTDEGGRGAAVRNLLPRQPDADRRGAPADGVTLLPTPNAAQGRGTGTPSRETAVRRMYAEGRRFLDDAVALLPTPRATDGTKGGPNQRGSSGDLMLPSAVVQLLPTPTSQAAKHSADDRGPGTLDDCNLWSVVTREAQWGDYGPAIARWEHITGRPAPDPTETGTKGQQRLSPAFVEWLMGLPAGWVTDHLPRNPALRCLGNGVVWQQAAHAFTELLDLTVVEVDALALPSHQPRVNATA